MDDTSRVLIITQFAVIAAFAIKEGIRWVIHFAKRAKEKEITEQAELKRDITDLKIQIGALRAQLEVTMKHLFTVDKLEKDLNALFEKVRNSKVS